MRTDEKTRGRPHSGVLHFMMKLLTDPKYVLEFLHCQGTRPPDDRPPHRTAARAHEMGIYKRYCNLIATGRKTTEIRVNDSRRRRMKKGSLIRFRCQGDEVLTWVTRLARYISFDEMFDHEEVASVNPLATREEQLANIRQIYPPNAKPSASSPSASNWSTHTASDD